MPRHLAYKYLTKMERIATYVFLDLETTGLPREEHNKTRITELSMVAVKRRHILDTSLPRVKSSIQDQRSPRVKHKLTLCFNPGRMVSPVSTEKTGLCNDLLEHEPYFDMKSFVAINSFLQLLEKPICLIAHNGNSFDFPILKNHLDKLRVTFSDGIMCADTFHGFYDILDIGNNISVESEKKTTEPTCAAVIEEKVSDNESSGKHGNEDGDERDGELFEQKLMQIENELTPRKRKNHKETVSRPSKVRRGFPWGKESQPKDSYKLEEVFKRVVSSDVPCAHQAENDCIMDLEISATLKEKFVEWIDKNCYSFSQIEPMALGASMG